MQRRSLSQSKLSGLELLLALAALILLVQLSPSIWDGVVRAIDVRNWSASTWLVVNLLIIFALTGIKYTPEIQDFWRERKTLLAEKRRQFVAEKTRTERVRRIKENRQLTERIIASRSRRLY